MSGGARWMGVGRSSAADARGAGAEAARRALVGADPKLLIVFAAVGYDPAALAEGVAGAAPGVPVVGCSTNGEITPDGPGEGTVVVTAIGGSGLWVSTAAEEGLMGRQREAGAAVASAIEGVPDRPNKVLMLLTDGYTRSQENILRGVYGVVGAGVPLFGGAAAGRDGRTFQLHGSQVLGNGVVAAAIASDGPLGIGVSHGFQTVGDAMVVTRSDQARVYTLDREPALDKYLRTLDAPPEVYHDPAAFSRWTLTRPLGVQRRSGVAAKNISHDVDFDGRTIGGGTEIVQGALLWATEGDAGSILDAVEVACEQAVAALGDHPPVGLLTLSCMGCRAVLGTDGIAQEAVRIAGRARGAPFAGFYTLGEIARTRGVDGFHNQTLVVLALG
ncbi:MAG: hypothetical protein AUI10_06040 [Actinobacteria bacterium 13_2_20CM_2_72_6]|nr:MAG: hypothetical protein AUI10_06040 [Actinobacteria bacterium 13_2_20CM_2_72_6]